MQGRPACGSARGTRGGGDDRDLRALLVSRGRTSRGTGGYGRGVLALGRRRCSQLAEEARDALWVARRERKCRSRHGEAQRHVRVRRDCDVWVCAASHARGRAQRACRLDGRDIDENMQRRRDTERGKRRGNVDGGSNRGHGGAHRGERRRNADSNTRGEGSGRRSESLVPEKAKRLEREATRAVDTTRALRNQASRLRAVTIATESAAATIAEWALLLAYTLSGSTKNTCIDSSAITTVGQQKKSSDILKEKCDALYSDRAKGSFSPLTARPAKETVTRIIAELGKGKLEATVSSALERVTGTHVGAKLHRTATTASCPILAAYQDSTDNYGLNIDSSAAAEQTVTFGTFFTLTTKSSGSDGSIAFKRTRKWGRSNSTSTM
ncbi:hypothetical protein ERJ75_000452700 [Trypanosoma vivax]|nr:hypothetical protein ERJ75_000452700 [Trypanosoma vivax]